MTIFVLCKRLAGLSLALSVLGGCTGATYEQGLQWHLENEAHKRELERQGFPQYSPPL